MQIGDLRVVVVAPGEYAGQQSGYDVRFGIGGESGIMLEFQTSVGVRGIAERVTVESDGKQVRVKS